MYGNPHMEDMGFDEIEWSCMGCINVSPRFAMVKTCLYNLYSIPSVVATKNRENDENPSHFGAPYMVCRYLMVNLIRLQPLFVSPGCGQTMAKLASN